MGFMPATSTVNDVLMSCGCICCDFELPLYSSTQSWGPRKCVVLPVIVYDSEGNLKRVLRKFGKLSLKHSDIPLELVIPNNVCSKCVENIPQWRVSLYNTSHGKLSSKLLEQSPVSRFTTSNSNKLGMAERRCWMAAIVDQCTRNF